MTTAADEPNFSRQKILEKALATKLRRAHCMAKGGINATFDLLHNSEVQEFAATQSYTEVDIRIQKEFDDYQLIKQARREKLGQTTK